MLKRHFRRLAKEKCLNELPPHPCVVSEETFTVKKNLRQHLKVAQHELRFYLLQGIKACVSQLNAASSDTDM